MIAMSPTRDALGRPLRSLRVSVTDRCNLRCEYCMPEEEYVWLPRQHLLTFEEIGAIVDAFSDEGVDRVRITGGEPLVRPRLPALVERLAARPALEDLALTTNGVLLAAQARDLRAAGLHRLTVSLDTLQPDRFRRLTRLDAHAAVLRGLDAAADAGFDALKIDTVVLRGVNDDELAALVDFGREVGAEVRFIEYMDVGGATRWTPAAVVPRAEILERLAAHHGPAQPIVEDSAAPAERFCLPDGTVFGIIASVTQPFCRTCDRSRLTADGLWFLCLYGRFGTDLRGPLRRGASRDELRSILARVWRARTERGAEERVSLDRRTPLIPISALKQDAHLEMHTRGG
ncbi:MAG: GTP 3',8-cyclase MoaA [Vicinamibacterales bacterium]